MITATLGSGKNGVKVTLPEMVCELDCPSCHKGFWLHINGFKFGDLLDDYLKSDVVCSTKKCGYIFIRKAKKILT